MSLLKNILLAGMRRRLPGFGFVTSRLYPQGIITANKYGVRMQLDPYEAVEGSVLFDGYFDEPVLDQLVKNIRQDDVFWDVGANVGLHTFTIKKLAPTLTCFAFEPFYKNFARLCVNQNLNPHLKISKYNLALASNAGIETLYTSANNAGRTSLNPLENSTPTEIHISTVTGDDLLRLGIAQPNIIKLDTEGTELAILRGCKDVLKANKLRAVLYESFSQHEAIAQYLTDFGFKVTPIDSLSNFIATR